MCTSLCYYHYLFFVIMARWPKSRRSDAGSSSSRTFSAGDRVTTRPPNASAGRFMQFSEAEYRAAFIAQSLSLIRTMRISQRLLTLSSMRLSIWDLALGRLQWLSFARNLKKRRTIMLRKPKTRTWSRTRARGSVGTEKVQSQSGRPCGNACLSIRCESVEQADQR